MKASDLLARCLENEWVEYIYGVPGEENLDFLESLKHSSIKLIVTRNEQTAVFMAATYGRLTGKAWVALATLWPGATNMVTGIAHAQLGGMPVIVITGQKPIKKSKQGRFQIIDVVDMMRPITKRATSVPNGNRIPSIIRQAFKVAEDEKPGAVHIELAEDIAAEEVTQTTIFPREKIRRPQIDQKMLAILVDRIRHAKTPMILVWSGANRKRITNYLTKFIEKTNIPFFTSQMGKWVVTEALPQYLGTAALTAKDYIHPIIDMADLLIVVGYDIVEKPTNYRHSHPDRQIIHINFTPADVDDIYMPQLEVVGDIGNTFWQLDETDLHAGLWNFDTVYTAAATMKSQMAANMSLEKDSTVLMPRRMIAELRWLLGPEDILALDNGFYKVRVARNYPAYAPNTVLLDNALATMGAGYSVGMTAKMLNPDKKVVCLVGDGWLLMNLWDIETAVRLWLDLVIVVLNDNAYGMIKWKQKDMWFSDYGLDLGNPNFIQLAESFGATGLRVEKADDFAWTIQRALDNTGVTIVEVLFAYPQKVE
jgi:acetolactate synthase-1/2/3 large subunit